MTTENEGQKLSETSTVTDLQANAFTDFFIDMFHGIGGLFTSSQKQELSKSIVDFVGTDVGKLAVDAVEFVQVSLPGAGSVEKRDAAVAKLKADAAAAGKDLSTLATSMLNLFIELALQFVLSKGVTIAAAAIK